MSDKLAQLQKCLRILRGEEQVDEAVLRAFPTLVAREMHRAEQRRKPAPQLDFSTSERPT